MCYALAPWGEHRESICPVAFDASLLSKGDNALTLDLLPARDLRERRLNYPHFGVMYDFLQLEVEQDDEPPKSEQGSR